MSFLRKTAFLFIIQRGAKHFWRVTEMVRIDKNGSEAWQVAVFVYPAHFLCLAKKIETVLL